MPSLLFVIQTHFLKCYFLSLQFSLLFPLLNCALNMAAFTHQYQPFHLDSLFMSNCVFKMSDSLAERGDIINNSNPILFPPLPQSDLLHQYLQHIPSVDSSSSSTVVNSPQDIISEPSVSGKTMITLESPSIPVDFGGSDQVIGIPKKIITTTSMGKKRKNKDESCMNSTLHQSKQDEKRAKATKKRRKNNLGSLELTEDHKKSCKADKKKNHSKVKKDPQNTTDYVHVRARRGQATDSHSLAERVRREKISERLKVLQDLVPGCDKVGSKALMLDEIINYVQSLQLQVEMLSMKLAYVNPMFYGFGLDSDGFLVEPEEKLSILGSQVSSFQEQSNAIISTAFVDNNTSSFSSTKNNIPLLDNSSSVSLSLQQEQRPSDYFTHNQGNEDLLWHMGYQRQRFINQLGATNMCFLE